MSSLDVSKIGLQVVALALLLTVTLSSQQPGSSILRRPIPASVMAAAARRGDPESFAHVLASLRVPAGIVLQKHGEGASDVSFDPNAPGGPWALGDAIEGFRRVHTDYVLDDDETGIFLVPKTSGCVAPTSRMIDVEQGGGPLYFVLWQIAKVVDPATPQVPPSVVGGGGALDARGERDLFRERVRSLGRSASLRATLMDLSRQVPGVVWALREGPGRDGAPSVCTLTLLTADRTLTTSYRIQ